MSKPSSTSVGGVDQSNFLYLCMIERVDDCVYRLYAAAKVLAARLRNASPSQQRAASRLACQLAMQASALRFPVALAALHELQSTGSLSDQRVTELSGLASSLDKTYFDRQDGPVETSASGTDALRLFSQARAVSALSLAGGKNPLVAALESIYESGAAVDDAHSVYDAVLNLLKT